MGTLEAILLAVIVFTIIAGPAFFRLLAAWKESKEPLPFEPKLVRKKKDREGFVTEVWSSRSGGTVTYVSPPENLPEPKRPPKVYLRNPDGSTTVYDPNDDSTEIVSPDGWGSVKQEPVKEPEPFARFSLIDTENE